MQKLHFQQRKISEKYSKIKIGLQVKIISMVKSFKKRKLFLTIEHFSIYVSRVKYLILFEIV